MTELPLWAKLLLAVFATYRVTQFITIDTGPLDLCFHLRNLAGVYRRDARGIPLGQAGKLFGCPHCIGWWAALVHAALVLAMPAFLIDFWLLAWGLAGLQSRLQGKRQAE